MKNKSLAFKICLFGDGGVGKTSLCHKYLYSIFDKNIKYTMGAEILAKNLKINEHEIRLQIWDFGGEKEFRFLLTSYSKGASGGIFMYDITRFSSLERIKEWFKLFREGLRENDIQFPMLMVGGKLDLNKNRAFEYEIAKEYANQFNCFDCIECSSRTGENVELVFETLVRKILETYNHL